jgi:hypothetical protein
VFNDPCRSALTTSSAQRKLGQDKRITLTRK